MIRYLVFLGFLFSAAAPAAENDLVLDTAERYVRQQTQGLPGKVQIKMGTLDVTRLPPCTAHEGFSPSGARLSGKRIRTCQGTNSRRLHCLLKLHHITVVVNAE